MRQDGLATCVMRRSVKRVWITDKFALAMASATRGTGRAFVKQVSEVPSAAVLRVSMLSLLKFARMIVQERESARPLGVIACKVTEVLRVTIRSAPSTAQTMESACTVNVIVTRAIMARRVPCLYVRGTVLAEENA